MYLPLIDFHEILLTVDMQTLIETPLFREVTTTDVFAAAKYNMGGDGCFDAPGNFETTPKFALEPKSRYNMHQNPGMGAFLVPRLILQWRTSPKRPTLVSDPNMRKSDPLENVRNQFSLAWGRY